MGRSSPYLRNMKRIAGSKQAAAADTDAFTQAFREWSVANREFHSFEDLPKAAQHAILNAANDLKRSRAKVSKPNRDRPLDRW